MRLGVPVLALACVLVAVPAAAVDRVVDDKGVACLSGRPLHTTISAAVAAAVPGEKILVCAGTYSENVTVNKADLTLQGQGTARLQPGNASAPGIEVVADGVTIQGFDISGLSAGGFNCGIRVAAERADINGNRLQANDGGICISGGSGHRVRYNAIQNNRGGVTMFGTTGPVDVSNNTLKDNEFGISAIACAPGVTIDHNAVTGGRVALAAGDARSQCNGFVITNNTLRGPGASTPGSTGLRTFASDDGVLTRNNIQDFGTGVRLDNADGWTASFNSISSNGFGIVVLSSGNDTVTRNNVSRSTFVDCIWDGSNVNVLTGNNCGTQSPPGTFD